jgi:hypothetical protein
MSIRVHYTCKRCHRTSSRSFTGDEEIDWANWTCEECANLPPPLPPSPRACTLFMLLALTAGAFAACYIVWNLMH